jgi:membrane-associated phospholipid phosphatase
LAEIATVVGLTAGSLAISEDWTPPNRALWSSPILFDNAVRSALRGRTFAVQSTASQMSDYLYQGTVLAPYVVDVFLVTLSIHESADVAIQMLLMNMQSLGLSGVATLASEHAVGRARPYTRDCRADGSVVDARGRPLPNSCGNPEDFQSFYSGHTAATATMAGLTCAHHQHLPLYGGGTIAEAAPCVFMITASLTTGVTRIIADRHWATDVVTGAAIGALSGYVLPSLLHYGFGHGKPIGEIRQGSVVLVPVPTAYPGGLGMGVGGLF